jgi:surfeit locus 1 family protein
MKWRTVAFIAASAILAVVFVRLGVWQLDRLHERRQRNAFLRERMRGGPIPLATLAGRPDELRYRRVRVSGRADYAHEFVYASRTRDGSPGVYLMTPVMPFEGDTAVLVARGWVYSPDGATVDASRWREGDSLTVDGYLEEIPPASARSDTTAGRPGTVTRLDRQRMEKRIGRPLRAVYVMATGDSTVPAAGQPARFTLPELDDGPHKSYAFQWFSFAAIAVVGAGIVIRNERRDSAGR